MKEFQSSLATTFVRGHTTYRGWVGITVDPFYLTAQGRNTNGLS